MTIGTISDPVDFPTAPVDMQVHTENGRIYVFVAKDNAWIGGRTAQTLLLKRGNAYLSHVYLGLLDHDPSVGLEGFSLLGGEIYYNVIEKVVKVYDPINHWQSVTSSTKGLSNRYVYDGDGAKVNFTGVDVNGSVVRLVVKPPSPVNVYVSGVKLIETTAAVVGGYTVDHATSTITLTRAPRLGARVEIEVLLGEDANAAKGGDVHTLGPTPIVNAAAGPNVSAKISSSIAPSKSAKGTIVIIPYIAANADNSLAGIWVNNGREFTHDLDLSSVAGTTVFHTTGAIIKGQKTNTATDTPSILRNKFRIVFGKVPKQGDFVVVDRGPGDDSLYAGLFFYNGIEWISAAAAWSNTYAQAFIKNSVHSPDNDINALSISQGSAQYTFENDNKEIKVVNDRGNWVPIFSETKVKEWIAAGSLFQGTFNAGSLGKLPIPAANNRGAYWAYSSTNTASINIAGQKPQIDTTGKAPGTVLFKAGDWLQSDGHSWIHVSADLLSLSAWAGMGTFAEWVTNTPYARHSLVKYNGRYYRAEVEKIAGVGDPITSGWTDITPAVSPEKLNGVKYHPIGKSKLEDGDVLQRVGADWCVTQLVNKLHAWDPAKDYTTLGEVVYVHNNGLTVAAHAAIYVCMIATNNHNRVPVNNADYWQPLVVQSIEDLANVWINGPEENDVLIYDDSTGIPGFKNSRVNAAFEWRSAADYNANDIVSQDGIWYVAEESIPANASEPKVEANKDTYRGAYITTHISTKDQTYFSRITTTVLANVPVGYYFAVQDPATTTLTHNFTIKGGEFDGVVILEYTPSDKWLVVNTGVSGLGVDGFVMVPESAVTTGTGALPLNLTQYCDLKVPTHTAWKAIGITRFSDLLDVALSNPQDGAILKFKRGLLVNTTLDQLLQWEAKTYPPDSLVIFNNQFYKSKHAITDGIINTTPDTDAAGNWELVGLPSLEHLTDVDTTNAENGFVIAYNLSKRNWEAVKNFTLPDGNDEGNGAILLWDDAEQEWVVDPRNLGEQNNVDGYDAEDSDGGSFVYDFDNSRFDLRKLVLDDLDDVSADVDLYDNDILTWSDADQKWVPTRNAPTGSIRTAPVATVALQRTGFADTPHILDSKFTAMFPGETAQKGDIVVIDDGVGPTEHWNGVFYYDGTEWKELVHDTLSRLKDVDVTSTPPNDNDSLAWDDTAKKWAPKAASKTSRPFFPWDAAETYKVGNIVEFNDKLYMAKNKATAYVPPVANTDVAFHGVDAMSITFADWIAQPPAVGDSYNNGTGGDLVITGHGLMGYVLKNLNGLVWLGLNEHVNMTFAGTEKIVGGLYVNTGVSKTSFSQPDLDLIIAADALANLPPVGANPSISTMNWVVVGEKNADVGSTIYMGREDFSDANVSDPTKNFGMAPITQPSPQAVLPQAGDRYLSLDTAKMYFLTGNAHNGRKSSTITGGTGVSISAKTSLHLDGSNSPNKDIDWGNKKITNLAVATADDEAVNLKVLTDKVNEIINGLAHGIEVQSNTLTTPPTLDASHLGKVWVVPKTTATGAWTGHGDALAIVEENGGNYVWYFETASLNEAHFVEDTNKTIHWNGTDWSVIANVGKAATGTTANGVGEIVGWFTPGALPDGLLALEGQILAIANFKELHDVIGNAYNAGTGADGTSTFALPDFRGYFLRGEGLNKDGTGDTGRGIGSTQTDQNKLHNHDINFGDAVSVFATQGKAFSLGGNTWSAGAIEGHMAATALGEQGGTEVRVKNVAVRWCIRIKGINAGIRGLTGKGYANGTAVGQTLSWDGTQWVPAAVAQLGWIYDKSNKGDHGFGTLDTKAFHTEVGAKYKVTAHYSASWSHDTNYINLRIKDGAKELTRTKANPAGYQNSETLVSVITGTGNIEVLSIEIFGSGGVLESYEWLIERIK